MILLEIMMPRSNKNDPQELAQDLAGSLKLTTDLIHNLMDEIKDNATSFAVLKERLESLGDSVEYLSHIVRDGNGKGSLLTRLALFEQSLNTIEDKFDDFKDEAEEAIKEIRESIEDEKAAKKDNMNEEQRFKRRKMLERLKVAAVVAPGLIALIIMLIKLLTGTEGV